MTDWTLYLWESEPDTGLAYCTPISPRLRHYRPRHAAPRFIRIARAAYRGAARAIAWPLPRPGYTTHRRLTAA